MNDGRQMTDREDRDDCYRLLATTLMRMKKMTMTKAREDLSLLDNGENLLNDQSLSSLEVDFRMKDNVDDGLAAMYTTTTAKRGKRKKRLCYLTLSENAYCALCVCRLRSIPAFFQVIVGNQIQMA